MLYRVEYPESRDSYYFTKRERKHAIEAESEEVETAKVDRALQAFHKRGHLATTEYDSSRFGALRQAVRENYEITWTSITPPMERLLYAVAATKQPKKFASRFLIAGGG